MKHLIHVLLVVFAATAGTLLLGAGASASSLLAGFGFAAVATVVVVPLGVATLIAARSLFGLVQAGRLLQMALFWALMWGALALAPAAMVTVVNGCLASLVILGAVMVLAAITGGFASGFKRSWLPTFRSGTKD